MPLLSAEGEEIGHITSGSFGPSVGEGIALGYLPPTYAPGAEVYISVRGMLAPLPVVKPPFLTETSLTRRQKA
jgi:aminomethyltransferase